jgi:hypothetical protein
LTALDAVASLASTRVVSGTGEGLALDMNRTTLLADVIIHIESSKEF